MDVSNAFPANTAVRLAFWHEFQTQPVILSSAICKPCNFAKPRFIRRRFFAILCCKRCCRTSMRRVAAIITCLACLSMRRGTLICSSNVGQHSSFRDVVDHVPAGFMFRSTSLLRDSLMSVPMSFSIALRVCVIRPGASTNIAVRLFAWVQLCMGHSFLSFLFFEMRTLAKLETVVVYPRTVVLNSRTGRGDTGVSHVCFAADSPHTRKL